MVSSHTHTHTHTQMEINPCIHTCFMTYPILYFSIKVPAIVWSIQNINMNPDDFSPFRRLYCMKTIATAWKRLKNINHKC